MQLKYDDDFVEGAVFVRANSRQHAPAALQVRRFHAGRERLYTVLDPDERNAAFFQLHLDWFREWGLERLLLSVVDEFPLFRAALGALVFRKASAKNDESAELYVNTVEQAFLSAGSPDFPVRRSDGRLESRPNLPAGKPALPSRSAVVALRVERFERPDELVRFLRHEFTHVHDMLNPAFGYSPQLSLSGRNAAQQRLTRERYRLLWDITIDGRLGAGELRVREQHRAAFDRAFGFWPEPRRDEVFDALWRDRSPRHEELLAIAADPRDLKSTHEPTPGAPCPLCGFSTFDWADMSALADTTSAAIQREFPHWTPADGACGRCLAIYRVAAVPRNGAPPDEILTADYTDDTDLAKERYECG